MCMDCVYFYGLLCLLFMFHGMINEILGQMCSCIDSGNCDFTHQCVPEDACVKENVALGKVATISSLKNNSGPACLMVNGNTTMAYSTKNCVMSGYQDNYPSWTVDLGQDYTITNVSIYPEPSYSTGLRGVEITVDGRLCYTFPEEPDYYGRQDVQCTQPQRGRIVKLFSSNNYYIFLCELQIWVCIDGYYGNDCGFRCGNCLEGVCDKINGTCPNGCEAGWQNNYCNQECDDGYYGFSCNHTCGKCANFNICNKATGVCLGGCDSGWTTPFCNQTCGNGTYGQNCSGLCGNCEPCDKISGACLTCEPGLKLALCQQVAVTSENSGNTVGAIVGAILGGFAILGIIIAVTLVLYLRHFKSRSTDSRTKTITEHQRTSDKSASIKSPTNGESANVESGNEYDEIENQYNSLQPVDQSEQHNYSVPAFEERNAKPAKDKPVYINTITSINS